MRIADVGFALTLLWGCLVATEVGAFVYIVRRNRLASNECVSNSQPKWADSATFSVEDDELEL